MGAGASAGDVRPDRGGRAVLSRHRRAPRSPRSTRSGDQKRRAAFGRSASRGDAARELARGQFLHLLIGMRRSALAAEHALLVQNRDALPTNAPERAQLDTAITQNREVDRQFRTGLQGIYTA